MRGCKKKKTRGNKTKVGSTKAWVRKEASKTGGTSIPPADAIVPTRRRVYYALLPRRAEPHNRSVTRYPFPVSTHSRETNNKTKQTETESSYGLGELTDVHLGVPTQPMEA